MSNYDNELILYAACPYFKLIFTRRGLGFARHQDYGCTNDMSDT